MVVPTSTARITAGYPTHVAAKRSVPYRSRAISRCLIDTWISLA